MHIWAFTPRSPETDCAVPQGKVTWQLRSRLRERGLDLGAVGVNLPQMGADEAVGVHGTYCGCDEIPDKSNLRKDFFFCDSQFEGAVHHGGEGPQAADHTGV